MGREDGTGLKMPQIQCYQAEDVSDAKNFAFKINNLTGRSEPRQRPRLPAIGGTGCAENWHERCHPWCSARQFYFTLGFCETERSARRGFLSCSR